MSGRSRPVDEIQRDALDRSVSIADALRKAVALGGLAGSGALREWARRELHGYTGSGVKVPEYRKPLAVLLDEIPNDEREVLVMQHLRLPKR